MRAGVAAYAPAASDLGRVDRHRPVPVIAHPEGVEPLAVIQVLVLVAQDRQRVASVLAPASAGSGVVQANWCSSGVSGSVRPTIAATFGAPRSRRSTRRCRPSISPLVGDDGAHRAVLDPDADHLVPGQDRRPALGGPAHLRIDGPHRFGQPVRRGVQPGQDGPPDRAAGGARRSRRRRAACDSTPHAVSQPCRRCSSATRSGVVATSRPPTGRKQGSPSTSSAPSFSTV